MQDAIDPFNKYAKARPIPLNCGANVGGLAVSQVLTLFDRLPTWMMPRRKKGHYVRQLPASTCRMTRSHGLRRCTTAQRRISDVTDCEIKFIE